MSIACVKSNENVCSIQGIQVIVTKNVPLNVKRSILFYLQDWASVPYLQRITSRVLWFGIRVQTWKTSKCGQNRWMTSWPVSVMYYLSSIIKYLVFENAVSLKIQSVNKCYSCDFCSRKSIKWKTNSEKKIHKNNCRKKIYENISN